MTSYKARLDSIIEMLGKPQEADGSLDPEHYRGKLPHAMVELWQRAGTGLVLGSFFQLCNPARYASIMELVFDGDPDIRPEQTHVLGFGAFGTMLAWNEVYQDMCINLVNGRVSCSALTSGETYDPNIAVTTALMLLDDPILDEYDADAEQLFERAKEKLGPLRFGQVYGFKPILAFGGSRELSRLAIYDAPAHMAILAQAHRMHLMDNAVYPPQPVRPIGE